MQSYISYYLFSQLAVKWAGSIYQALAVASQSVTICCHSRYLKPPFFPYSSFSVESVTGITNWSIALKLPKKLKVANKMSSSRLEEQQCQGVTDLSRFSVTVPRPAAAANVDKKKGWLSCTSEPGRCKIALQHLCRSWSSLSAERSPVLLLQICEFKQELEIFLESRFRSVELPDPFLLIRFQLKTQDWQRFDSERIALPRHGKFSWSLAAEDVKLVHCKNNSSPQDARSPMLLELEHSGDSKQERADGHVVSWWPQPSQMSFGIPIKKSGLGSGYAGGTEHPRGAWKKRKPFIATHLVVGTVMGKFSAGTAPETHTRDTLCLHGTRNAGGQAWEVAAWATSRHSLCKVHTEQFSPLPFQLRGRQNGVASGRMPVPKRDSEPGCERPGVSSRAEALLVPAAVGFSWCQGGAEVLTAEQHLNFISDASPDSALCFLWILGEEKSGEQLYQKAWEARCTASPIWWNQCSNRSYKRCDNVQPPI
ncbi:hypothetical protein IHE44_0012656 [Lamprotornis superbus]|uniref:Uncharacterized protein n=1 Tax=Lamprotornis superbus TaxID=245042 RepID=A0A835NLN2_9PASS|nr:hypothetical protein IHE44_0012656 [Lamprotornis superbus]